MRAMRAYFTFKKFFVFGVQVMNFDRKNSTRDVSVAQLNVSSKLIFLCQFIKRTKLMLPRKGFGSQYV